MIRITTIALAIVGAAVVLFLVPVIALAADAMGQSGAITVVDAIPVRQHSVS